MESMQQNLNTYLFDGHIELLSPFTSCTPAMSDAAGKGPKPVPKMVTPAGTRMFMSGAGIRSNLRRALTEVAAQFSALVANKQLQLRDAQILRLGGVKAQGKEEDISPIVMNDLLDKNPVLSLFGASTPWIRGKLMVGHAVDTRVIDKAAGWGPLLLDGVRTDPFKNPHRTDATGGLLQWLDGSMVKEVAETSAQVKKYSEMKNELAELERKIKAEKDPEERARLRKELAEKKEASKEHQTVSTLLPLAGFESIPMGATLEQTMRLRSATILELGALLAAIDGFADQAMGAHSAVGNGEIRARWEIRAGGDTLGIVSVQTFEGLIIEEDPSGVLADALSQFRASLQDPARFSFYALPEEKAEKKAKKAKKAGDETEQEQEVAHAE